MNLRKPVTTAVAAVVGCTLATTALISAHSATQSAPDNPPAFEEIDKNKDGSVSMTEAKDSWLAGVFTTVDADGNGSISKAEYTRATS